MKPHSNGSFYASEKTDVKFSCNIRRKGREVYQVHWEKDNKTLRAADHKRVTIVQRWLKIKNVKRGDAGLYSCIVLNKCGRRNVVHIRLYIRECKYVVYLKTLFKPLVRGGGALEVIPSSLKI